MIRTITVVGAGPVGRRLAARTRRAGYRTILEDLSGQWVDRLAADPALDGVEIARDLPVAASTADLVLEAAPDDLETKLEVYTLLDRIALPHAIFAPTSPAWPVSEVASLTYRAPLVVGLWVREDDLEAVRGPETSEETWNAICHVKTSFSSDRIGSGS